MWTLYQGISFMAWEGLGMAFNSISDQMRSNRSKHLLLLMNDDRGRALRSQYHDQVNLYSVRSILSCSVGAGSPIHFWEKQNHQSS